MTLVSYLHSHSPIDKVGKDTLMDRMVAESQLQAYQLFPNAFDHIGQRSTRSFLRKPFLVY